MQITSSENPKFKYALKLKEARFRKKEGRILIEGTRELELAMKADIKIDTLFSCEELLSSIPHFKQESILLSAPLFQKLSYRENPDGVIAIAKPKSNKLDEYKPKKNPLIIVLESVEKPGNLGAIARSADAAGADAILIADPRIDIFNPNAIRASQGTIFSIPILSDESQNIIDWLRKHKIRILATTPSANINYTDCNLKGGLAITAGTEDKGLSGIWLDSADVKTKIPMAGVIDSLNVSVSTAIILFEAVRQRRIANHE